MTVVFYIFQTNKRVYRGTQNSLPTTTKNLTKSLRILIEENEFTTCRSLFLFYIIFYKCVYGILHVK